tara:strand:- start:47 stop:280 length:234 start_codon:yes stop_codon:yes gene_type:complete
MGHALLDCTTNAPLVGSLPLIIIIMEAQVYIIYHEGISIPAPSIELKYLNAPQPLPANEGFQQGHPTYNLPVDVLLG